jgi:hypothetical protein
MQNVLADLRRVRGGDEALLDEIALADDPALSRMAEEAAAEVDEARARYGVERLALALQGSLLAPLRAGGRGRRVPRAPGFGLRDAGIRGRLAAAIVERHRPVVSAPAPV